MKTYKEKPYTHTGSFCGIPIYWNDDTNDMAGKNAVCDFLIEYVAIPFSNFMNLTGTMFLPGHYAPGFLIKLKKKL